MPEKKMTEILCHRVDPSAGVDDASRSADTRIPEHRTSLVNRSPAHLGALALLLGSVTPILGQTAEDFDPDRAMLSDAPMFDAF